MALISIISTYFGWKSMELEEFNKKQEIAFQTRFEHEQLEILEMEDTEFFDEKIGLIYNLLNDLARNENLSEKVQLLLAIKKLDSLYSNLELKKDFVSNKNLFESTFDILLGQNDIFLLYYILESVEISELRRSKVLQKLEDLGLSEILTEHQLYKSVHDFKFSEEVQSQILDHEYHLEYFVINPYLTELIQLKIVQSNYYEIHEHADVSYIGTSNSENVSDDDYIDIDDYHVESKVNKEYIYQIFAEKNKNISELALIALFNKNDSRVLRSLSNQGNLD